MSRREEVNEEFHSDISEHKMTVLFDRGLYRHIRFSSGSPLREFELLTYPGGLLFRGTQGTFVFEREGDLIEWITGIRNEELANRLSSYTRAEWTGLDGIMSFDPEAARQRVLMWVSAQPGISEEEISQAMSFFNDDDFRTEERLLDKMARSDELDHNSNAGRFGFLFDDCDEWDFDNFSRHFLWCVNAVSWGASRYIEAKKGEPHAG